MPFEVVGQMGPRMIFSSGGNDPIRQGQILWKNWTAQCNVDRERMWHCGVDVAYRRQSDWTRLQWALHTRTRSRRLHSLP